MEHRERGVESALMEGGGRDSVETEHQEKRKRVKKAVMKSRPCSGVDENVWRKAHSHAHMHAPLPPSLVHCSQVILMSATIDAGRYVEYFGAGGPSA